MLLSQYVLLAAAFGSRLVTSEFINAEVSAQVNKIRATRLTKPDSARPTTTAKNLARTLRTLLQAFSILTA